MVQGKTKGLQAKGSSSRHAAKAAAAPKKGKKYIAPKKAPLVQQAAARQQLSAKINKSIERQMVSAASSGKLTIMRHTIPEEGASSKSTKKK